MSEQLPFIYISALPRTGSTLISEVLSSLPFSFIFNEPHLGKNYFALQDQDVNALDAHRIDLRAFQESRLLKAFLLRRVRWLGVRQDFFVREFKRHLVPSILQNVRQIGVKEIKNTGWENYARHFPDMKVILLGRDPRDIYLSYYRLWRTGVVAWKGDFTPQKLASFVKKEFALQLSIKDRVETLNLRYEDFCTVPAKIGEIKSFVRSEIPDHGRIGAFVAEHPVRKSEWEMHGGSISQKSIYRWKNENDHGLVVKAFECFSLLSEYSKFWGYSP